ncbi:MAG: hypothetical protein JST16_02435 [Bdellovibrionales bacterium]|nr:hypothetical protein [Bdellovibrionales bacterium]
MSKFLVAALFALTACTNGNSSAKPPSGAKVPQLYVLFGGDRPREQFWAFPSVPALTEQLSARVEMATAPNLAAAKELLHSWNGRPADLLILGPGFPQRAWQEEKLPRVANRQVIFLAGEAGEDGLSLQIDGSRIRAFLTSFCGAKNGRGCAVSPDSLASQIPWPSPDKMTRVVEVDIKWREIFAALLRDRAQVTKQLRADFFSGFVELRGGRGLERGEEAKAFDQAKQNFMLSELAGRPGLAP